MNETVDEGDYLITALFKFAFVGLRPVESYFQTFGPSIRTMTFLAFLVYNASRFLLLLKSKELEHKKEISGIWPAFSMNDRVVVFTTKRFKLQLPARCTWRVLSAFVTWGTYLAILCVLWHSWAVMTIIVPE